MFVLLSLVMLRDIWREQTPLEERDTRAFKRDLYGMGKYRHRENGREMRERNAELQRQGRAALEQRRSAMRSRKRLTAVSKRQQKETVAGRLRLPSFLYTEWPRGFDHRLSAEVGGEPAYSTAPTAWFRESEEELLVLIRRHIPPFGKPSAAQKFRARMALQAWLADRLERRAHDAHSSRFRRTAP